MRKCPIHGEYDPVDGWWQCTQCMSDFEERQKAAFEEEEIRRSQSEALARLLYHRSEKDLECFNIEGMD